MDATERVMALERDARAADPWERSELLDQASEAQQEQNHYASIIGQLLDMATDSRKAQNVYNRLTQVYHAYQLCEMLRAYLVRDGLIPGPAAYKLDLHWRGSPAKLEHDRQEREAKAKLDGELFRMINDSGDPDRARDIYKAGRLSEPGQVSGLSQSFAGCWLVRHEGASREGDEGMYQIKGALTAVYLGDGSEGNTIVGYASTFGPPPDSVGDIVERGAFRDSIASRPTVPLLWAHDVKELLGSATLAENIRGLAFRGKISDTRRGRDVLALLKDGALTGVSFGYDVRQSHPGYGRDGVARYLDAIDLLEVSLVCFPANPRARVASNGRERAEIVDALQAASGKADLATIVALQRELEREQYGGRTEIELWEAIAHEARLLRIGQLEYELAGMN